jgi:RNA polymerase sigma-70 factor (ECF subfamily)
MAAPDRLPFSEKCLNGSAPEPAFIAVSMEVSGSPETEARASAPVAPRSRPLPTFDEVYAQHARFVFRVLRGMGVPDAQADDALQDVFLVVHQRLHEFDHRARVSTWLFQIALRVAQGYRRKTRRAREHTPIDDQFTLPAQSPQERTEAAQIAQRLQTLLDGLDEEKRVVLMLADLEELTVPEIAELTGTPLNTVYTRLRRARAALAAQWQKRGGER